jgi:uncharacterized protein (TIGR00730 family)
VSTAAANEPADELGRRIDELLGEVDSFPNGDLVRGLLATVVRLAGPGPDRLDLKIASAALEEMRSAFDAFAPYRNIPKVTMFGSARTQTADPLYAQAREVARELASTGWMVVTGAGPGIMAAGMEGAGRQHSFGVSIRLPFETSANEFIAGDPKLVSMKYFFTRKLMLMKESAGFVALPGGFGTLDETLELLTLQQTGKAVPAPIVLLDIPGGTYWHGWERFAREEVAAAGLISPQDLLLAKITDEVVVTREHITGFYRNYHSIRWVGQLLVMRLKARPTDAEIAGLQASFGHLCVQGDSIRRMRALPPEVSDGDVVDLPRIALRLDPVQVSSLSSLIDAVNALPSAPAEPAAPT